MSRVNGSVGLRRRLSTAPTHTSAASLPVLIIGSGLGGLTLAHSLQKHNIPCRIFERDSLQSQRAQGYRISIDSRGASGLKAAVEPEVFEMFEQGCAEQHPPGGRINGPSGRLERGGILGLLGTGGWGLVWALGSRYISKRWEKWTWISWYTWLGSALGYSQSRRPSRLIVPASVRKDYQADRRVTRSILLASQIPRITFESPFTSYTLRDDSVIAHFANGTSAIGSLLVGADGIRSRVASQLIGDQAAPLDLGMRLIYGKTPLTTKVEEALHPIIKKGVSFVTDTTSVGMRITLVLESMRFTNPGAPDNYMFWALTARQEIFKEDDTKLLALQGRAAAEIATRLTSKWDPSIRIIFDEQDVNETAVLRMTTSNIDGPPFWQTNRRVTVLGDAIHCMPPTGGQGANSALHDAAVLGMNLGISGEYSTDGWSEETIEGYEEAMRYNIGDVVGMACIAACKVLGAKPLAKRGSPGATVQ